MIRRLEGKNAIITGARTGIGRAITEQFLSEGCNVWAIVHRDDSEWLVDMNSIAQASNVWIKPVYINLENEEEVKNGILGIIQEKLPIDIVVNAAGVTSPNRLIPMTSMKDIHRVMQVNFFAAVHICQLVSKVMLRQRSGSIVNVASIAGLDGDLAQLEYAASKAALICATKKMAYEWGGFGIRVNAIAPGLIDTKMLDELDKRVLDELVTKTSLHRKGFPIEVAKLCAFLASEESSYISAQTIRIDGGGTNFISTFNRK